jgi:glucarate dehydratase
MADMAERFHKQWGFRVFKLKAGVLTPEEELRTLQLMNERFEEKFPLRIDPNARWTVKTAIRIGKAMRGLPLEYYEDPVPGQRDMAKVRQATGWMMSTNMCVTEFDHVPDAVRLQPVDVVLGDHHGWGGMAAFLELGRICETFGWCLSQHSNNHAGITMAAMIHVGATVPQLTCASDTHYVWLPEGADLIEGPKLPIAGGKMTVPAGPGLGVTLDRDKLARAHEVWRKCGMKERDDEATMQLIFPAWQRQRF